MVEEELGKIPRERIEWYPRLNQDLCTQCGVCVEFCHRKVFAAGDRTEVAHPYSCVVGCTGCQSQCPEGAISFPSLTELREMLRALREEFK